MSKKRFLAAGFLSFILGGCVHFKEENETQSNINRELYMVTGDMPAVLQKLGELENPEVLGVIREGPYQGYFFNVWKEVEGVRVVEVLDGKTNGKYLRARVCVSTPPRDILLEGRNIPYVPSEIRKIAGIGHVSSYKDNRSVLLQ